MSRLYALIDMAAEVHSLPGDSDGERFVTDRPHEMTPQCDCRPVVFWHSNAAPRPLYEHRDAAGQLQVDEGPVQ